MHKAWLQSPVQHELLWWILSVILAFRKCCKRSKVQDHPQPQRESQASPGHMAPCPSQSTNKNLPRAGRLQCPHTDHKLHLSKIGQYQPQDLAVSPSLSASFFLTAHPSLVRPAPLSSTPEQRGILPQQSQQQSSEWSSSGHHPHPRVNHSACNKGVRNGTR